MKLDVQPAVVQHNNTDEDDLDELLFQEKYNLREKTISPSQSKNTEITKNSHHNKNFEKRDSFSKLLDSFGRIL